MCGYEYLAAYLYVHCMHAEVWRPEDVHMVVSHMWVLGTKTKSSKAASALSCGATSSALAEVLPRMHHFPKPGCHFHEISLM